MLVAVSVVVEESAARKEAVEIQCSRPIAILSVKNFERRPPFNEPAAFEKGFSELPTTGIE